MTKKDYQLIASALKTSIPNKDWLNKRLQYVMNCRDLSLALASKNPNFQVKKFLADCGLDTDEEL